MGAASSGTYNFSAVYATNKVRALVSRAMNGDEASADDFFRFGKLGARLSCKGWSTTRAG